jgi:hypothetical protein
MKRLILLEKMSLGHENVAMLIAMFVLHWRLLYANHWCPNVGRATRPNALKVQADFNLEAGLDSDFV